MRHFGLAGLVVFCVAVGVQAQTLVGLRIEGPSEVVEQSLHFYSVIAEFDNGWEFDVTLDCIMWTEPGVFADIGVFGDLQAAAVEQDEIESIHAFYAFGLDVASDLHDVLILDAPPAGFALAFDGSNDYAMVSNSQALSITSSLTIEAWIRLHSLSGWWQQIVFKGDDRSGFDPYYLRADGALLEFGIHDDAGTWAELSAAVGGYDWGQYHHVAAVFYDELDRLCLYVDGQLIAEQETGLHPMFDQDGMDLYFGQDSKGLQSYDGDLDEVRIWNVPRTACQIHSTMNRPLNGSEPGLVGYWRFDDCSAQVAVDSSLYGQPAVLGANDSPAGDSADPQWVVSGAGIDSTPFDPPFWSSPELIPDVSSGEDWTLAISSDELDLYVESERDGFAESEVYRAARDSVEAVFPTPVPDWELSLPGYRYHDSVCDLSASGLRFYLNRHYWHDPADLYVAERSSRDEPWGVPVLIDSLNTAASEDDLAVSGDELSAVLTSSRSGANRYWLASRATVDDPWGGLALIDTLEGFEPRGCALSDDGLILYVTAEGPTGLGSYDVWRLVRPSTDAPFGQAVHLPEVSSAVEEWDVSLSGDGHSMYLVSKRDRYQSGSVFVSRLVDPGALAVGDLDCDGDADLDDCAVLFACLAGPGNTTLPVGCTAPEFNLADLDGDWDVDMADFRVLQAVYDALN